MSRFLSVLTGLWQNHKRLVIILAVCVGIVGTGGVAAGVYFNTPEVVAINSVKNFVDDLLDRDEFSAVNNMIDGGSLEASLSEISNEGENLLEDASFSGKLYFSKKAYMLEDLSIKIKEAKINADIYGSYDLVYISEKNILDGAYGTTPGDIADEFADSIFAYGSGSEYEITDKETYDTILDTLKSLDTATDIGKDANKVIKKVTKDIYKIVVDNAEFEAENDKERVGGERKKVRIITIKLSEKDVANIVKDICKYLQEDETIIEFLEKHEDYLSGALHTSGAIEKDKTIVDAYEKFLEEFDENIDKTCDEIKEDEIDLEIELFTSTASSKLLKISVDLNDKNAFSLDVGAKGIKNSDCITLKTDDDTVFEYKIEENNKKSYVAELTVGEEKVLKIDVNREDERFKVTTNPDGEYKTVIKGNLSTKGTMSKTITLEVNEIVVTNYDYYEDKEVENTVKLDLTVIINEKDKIPTPPSDYKTIDEITDKDIDTWIEKAQEFADNFTDKVN